MLNYTSIFAFLEMGCLYGIAPGIKQRAGRTEIAIGAHKQAAML